MSLLEVKDLSVHFHDARPERFAVGGISFSMEEGEILVRAEAGRRLRPCA